MKPRKILRKGEVSTITGLGISTLYKWMAEDKFPRSISLGGRSVGWIESEIFDWINQRIEERDL